MDNMPTVLLRSVAVSAIINVTRPAAKAAKSLGLLGYERRGELGEAMEIRSLTTAPPIDAKFVKNSLRGKMREVMADDQWHTIGELAVVLGPYVRPEVAIRRFHNHRRRTSEEYNKAVYDNEPMDVKVALGTLNYIQDSLTDIGCIWRGPRGAREYRLLGGVQTLRYGKYHKQPRQEDTEEAG